MRTILTLAFMLASTLALADSASIYVTPDSLNPHKKMEFGVTFPQDEEWTDVSIIWTVDKSIDAHFNADKTAALFWSTPGEKTLSAIITCIDFENKRHSTYTDSTTFTVQGKTPEPTPATLCDLIKEGEDANAYVRIFNAQINVLHRNTKVDYKAYVDAQTTMFKNHGLSPPNAVRTIQDNAVSEFGNDLEADGIEALIESLTYMVDDLANCTDPEPEPEPEPETGPKLVVVVYESRNIPTKRSEMLTELRSGRSSDYFRNNSHTLYLLDPDTKDEDRNKATIIDALDDHEAFKSLPAVFVLCKDDYELVDGANIPDDDPKFVIDFLKKHGG